MTRPILLCALLASSCATKEVKPDDSSATQHRAEASQERGEAAQHAAQYDPNAQRTLPPPARGNADAADPQIRTYNPTEWHIQEAARLTAHAKAHETAAAELEKFEAVECKDFQPKVRAACPVAGPIARVEDLPNGVRFVLVDKAPPNAVLAHMRCHLAWARTRGFENTLGCPAYIKGIEITLAADGKSIEVTSPDKKVATEVKKRSHDEAPKKGARDST